MIFMRGLSQAVNIVTFVVLVEENKDFTECGDKWLGKLHQCGNSGPSLQLGRPCRVNYLALDIFPSLPPGRCAAAFPMLRSPEGALPLCFPLLHGRSMTCASHVQWDVTPHLSGRAVLVPVVPSLTRNTLRSAWGSAEHRAGISGSPPCVLSLLCWSLSLVPSWK